MDWGIGKGYAGLFTSTEKRQSAKEELGVLQMLDQQMRNDRLEKEQADLKEQAYKAEVSKFADTLLAPDRARLNAKAKTLSTMIRESVKANGGDMTKFFANGGHKIMDEYKSSLINSPESSQYLDNKRNMERIIDMQSKGLGHLINQNDLFNLQNYQNGKGSKITYTGQLNQIDMPEFEWGQEIPVEQILYNKDNYVKIMGNYKMTYPDAPFPPSEEQIKQFTASQYAGQFGKNWQYPMAREREAFDQNMRSKEFDQKERNFKESSNQFWAQFQASRYDKTFDQTMELNKFELDKMGAGAPSIYSQYTNDPKEAEAMANAADTWAYNVQTMFSQAENDISNIGQINDKFWDSMAANFGKQHGFQPYEDSSEDYSNQGSGGLITMSPLRDWLNISYKPRASKLISDGNMISTALKSGKSKVLNLGEDGYMNGIDPSQFSQMYDAKGIRVDNWLDGSTKPGEKSWVNGKNYATELSEKKFKPAGLISIFTTKDMNGKQHMVMDAVKGHGSRKTDPKVTKKEIDARLDPNAKPSPGLAIVLRSDDGHTVYKVISDDKQELGILNDVISNDYGKVRQQMNMASKITNARNSQQTQSMKLTKEAFKQLSTDPELSKNLIQQARMIPGSGTAGNAYAPLVASFYASLQGNSGMSMKDISDAGGFNEMMNAVSANPQHFKQLQQLMSNPRTNKNTSIVSFLFQNGYINQEFAKNWNNTFNNLQKTR